jgi:hypothetical protein
MLSFLNPDAPHGIVQGAASLSRIFLVLYELAKCTCVATNDKDIHYRLILSMGLAFTSYYDALNSI